MPTGYCTLEDVRRALREKSLPGDIEQDTQIAIDAIVAQTEWFEKEFDLHFFEPDGITEDTEGLIATTPLTRDDEHDIPTHAGLVHGASETKRYRYRQNSDALLESGPRHDRRRRDFREPKQEIRLAFGELRDESVPAYTRVRFDRRYVQALNELHVVNANGAFDDWVASADYSGGVGNAFRGQDYWVRVNNDGVTELYLNVHSMDDDLASLSKGVYVDIDHGHDGLPGTLRRGIAFRAASDFVEEATIEIPNNATIYNVETKADEMREKADELLDAYRLTDREED